MRLIAKMRVGSVATMDYGCASSRSKTLTASPVCSSSDDDPNKAWSAATPSGKLELLVTNADAFDAIDALAGKTVLVTVEVVE